MDNKHKKSILFVSHDATRTGAPIVLLNFIEWLKKNDNYKLTLFLPVGGDIEGDFRNIITTHLQNANGLIKKAVRKAGRKLKLDKGNYKFPEALAKQKFDLVYINTVVPLKLAADLKRTFNCPIICHVHENEFTIENHFPGMLIDENTGLIDHFIAVSISTADNLVARYHIDPKKISLVYEFIPVKKISSPALPAAKVRDELGLTDEFIIGGSGLTSWRKGVDLFIQLALALNNLRPDNKIKLVWVGAISHEAKCQFDYEAERLNLRGKVIFTDKKPNPADYFQLFDVFALTSREDPFPLVALEAAALQKPILCFENSGGIPEIIKDDETGYVLPYADVNAMAQKILKLMDDAPLRKQLGKNAAELVARFDVAIAGKQLVEIIEQVTS